MAVASSSSVIVAVEKATSDLLIGPDWSMNIEICDTLNSNRWLAKDVMKAVKKRLMHKKPEVQLLALTLLETMVKNCGDYIHYQIAEKNILGEMVKIVKKKTDMHVRDKILVLIDSWREAFGGPEGKHSQYYGSYEELRRFGVQFPRRSLDASPLYTSSTARSTMRHVLAGYGMPSNSARRLDETMATEIEGLNLTSLDSMRNVMELLGDMLPVVDPDDHEAIKDEIIVDLVNRCRSNQKKLIQMLTTTGDEELLVQGLELNDGLQVLLAKHDALASGLPMPTPVASLSPKPSQASSSNNKQTEVKQTEVKDSRLAPSSNTIPSTSGTSCLDEEEDDFSQLARRHSRPESSPLQVPVATNKELVPVETSHETSSATITFTPCNALSVPDPLAPDKTTKEQDMIDLLSLSLSTTSTTQSNTTHTPPTSNQSMPEVPVSSSQGYSYVPQGYPGNQGSAVYESYIVPWAQPQPQQQLQFTSQQQLQPQMQQQLQPRYQLPLYPQPKSQQQFSPQSQQSYADFQPQQQFQTLLQQQSQAQAHPPSQPQQQFKLHMQSQYPQYSSGYPPPPWAATPGYAYGQMHTSGTNMFPTRQGSVAGSYKPAQATTPMQINNTFAMNANHWASSVPRNSAPLGPKPFIPSYRLFEDLNVLGNTDGKFKMTGSGSPSLPGPPTQGVVGGRK